MDQAIKDNDVDAARYASLKADANQAETQWKEKKVERNEKRTEQRQLQALIDTHPIWLEYLSVRDHLTPLSNAPDVPEGWTDEVTQLISRNTEAHSKAETEKNAVKRVEQERDSIEYDEVGLSLAEQVKRLQQDDLEARYKTSFDIEHAQTERQRLQENIESQLSALGQPIDSDPKVLMVPVASMAEIKSLIAQFNVIDANFKTATNEWENASDELAAVKLELAELVVPEKDPADIKAALEQVNEAPQPGEFDTIANTVEQARTERNNRIAHLSPWRGDITTLLNLMLPDPDLIQRLKHQDNTLAEAGRTLTAEEQQYQDNLAQLNSTIDSLVQEAKVITDETAELVLQARNKAWDLHRKSLNQRPLPSAEYLQQSAETFAAAMSAYDQLLTTRLGQTTGIARLHEAQLERANTQAKLERHEEKQQEHSSKLQAHVQEVETLLGDLHLPMSFELSSLDLWLERHEQAIKAIENLEIAEADQRAQQQKFQEASNALEYALRCHGLVPENQSRLQLLQFGRETIERWNESQTQKAILQQSIFNAEKERNRRKRELAKVTAEKETWSQAWSSVLNKTWMGEQTPKAIEAILSTLDSLMAEVKQKRLLDDNISAMSDDRTRYCVEVQRLAEQAGEQYNKSDALITADLLRDRISRAEAARRSKEKAVRDLENAQKRLETENQQIEQINQRFEELRQTIPADSLESLRDQLNQGLERSRLQNRLMELERDIIRGLNQETIEASLALLNEHMGSAESLDKTKNCYESLSSDLADIEDHVSELYSDWQALKKQLETLGSDSTAAVLVEQREALLLDIKAGAHSFMRLSAGIMLATEALHIYRETHRSSMMTAANDAFQRITRGAFRGLETATQDNRELLFGTRADGSTILASEMSRGTRFQLYLALRIAGHAELARNGETLPFFADDILEPFDDDRSIETFSLLNSMAKHGQVVYLTHHRHLCELAKDVTGGGVRVHALPSKLALSTA